jgi:hypothetical protein
MRPLAKLMLTSTSFLALSACGTSGGIAALPSMSTDEACEKLSIMGEASLSSEEAKAALPGLIDSIEQVVQAPPTDLAGHTEGLVAWWREMAPIVLRDTDEQPATAAEQETIKRGGMAPVAPSQFAFDVWVVQKCGYERLVSAVAESDMKKVDLTQLDAEFDKVKAKYEKFWERNAEEAGAVSDSGDDSDNSTDTTTTTADDSSDTTTTTLGSSSFPSIPGGFDFPPDPTGRDVNSAEFKAELRAYFESLYAETPSGARECFVNAAVEAYVAGFNGDSAAAQAAATNAVIACMSSTSI